MAMHEHPGSARQVADSKSASSEAPSKPRRLPIPDPIGICGKDRNLIMVSLGSSAGD